MRIIALLGNLGALALLVYIAMDEWGGDPTGDVLMALLFLLVFINLYMFVFQTNKESFIALWLKRKALEEKNKIKKLGND